MYQNQYPQYPGMMQYGAPKKIAIDRVYGRQGVESFAMMPNCEALLLDTTAPVVWLVKTDSAGFKVYEAYDLVPHKDAPQIDMQSINERLTRLEAMISEPSTTDATGAAVSAATE